MSLIESLGDLDFSLGLMLKFCAVLFFGAASVTSGFMVTTGVVYIMLDWIRDLSDPLVRKILGRSIGDPIDAPEPKE